MMNFIRIQLLFYHFAFMPIDKSDVAVTEARKVGNYKFVRVLLGIGVLDSSFGFLFVFFLGFNTFGYSE